MGLQLVPPEALQSQSLAVCQGMTNAESSALNNSEEAAASQ